MTQSDEIRTGAADTTVFPGRYFDGRTGRAHDTAVAVGAAGVMFRDAAGAEHVWQPSQFERSDLSRCDDRIVLVRVDGDPARLCLPGLAYRALVDAFGRPVPQGWRQGLRPYRLPLAICVAVIGLYLAAVPILARMLAVGVSEQAETAFGAQRYQAFVASLQKRQHRRAVFCAAPAGLHSLAVLRDILLAVRPTRVKPQIAVLQSRAINAYNFGGGYIVMTSGLIDFVRSDAEAIGVLAHEIGHSEGRHHSREVVEGSDLTILSNLVFNASGFSTAYGLTGWHSPLAIRFRDMEREADRYATEVLRLAEVDPAAMADFSLRLRDRYGEDDDFFTTHPTLAERAAAFSTASVPGYAILDSGQWHALKRVCAERKTTAPAMPGRAG